MPAGVGIIPRPPTGVGADGESPLTLGTGAAAKFPVTRAAA